MLKMISPEYYTESFTNVQFFNFSNVEWRWACSQFQLFRTIFLNAFFYKN